LERQGCVVSCQIVDRLWGQDGFVDTEHGINTAIRKIRQALKDNPEQPRFIQRKTGKGYRFEAERNGGPEAPFVTCRNIAISLIMGQSVKSPSMRRPVGVKSVFLGC
jgi:hypothetical protein